MSHCYSPNYEQPDMPEPGDEQFREECPDDCDCEDCKARARREAWEERKYEPTADEVWEHYNS